MIKSLRVACILSLIILLTGFIGGKNDSDPIDGLVTFDGAFGPCTGLLVSPGIILTAMHCISKVPKAIIGDGNIRIISGPHFPTNIQLGIYLDGQFHEGLMKLSEVSFFAEYYHNNVQDISSLNIDELYKIGDLALLKLQTPFSESVIPKSKITQVGMIDPNIKGETVCVGGCGYQGSYKPFEFPENYKSSRAVLGEREDLLRAHISNLKDDISFLGPGDSGGPVILKTSDGPIVIGLNHSIEVSSVSVLNEIQLDEKTGEVLWRPKTPWAHEIGNFQLFFQDNLALKAWLLNELDYDPVKFNKTRCETLF